jgi:predicted Zn finger-like uncharacterized protein
VRFLCEQCKAKYQIADEKVAGKTVRMKCRKCGHLIEVKAEVTETSVATKAPQPQPDEPIDDATRIGMDVNAMMKLSSPATKGAPQATKPTVAKPATLPTKPGLATSLASAKPAKPVASREPERGSALAGAFHKSVAKDEERALLEISTSSEWYAAINGVPVGPVRIAELRRKAASGAVTEETLVWQEGMEEWRPLRTIPELFAIVQEGLTSERPSLSGTPQGAPRPSSPPPSAAPPRAVSRPDHARPAAVPPRSNVVSLSSRLATAEKLEPEEVADPFAAKSPISSSALRTDGLVAQANAPFSSVAAPTYVIPRKQGPNWIIIGMIVAFGAFGVTAGIAVFFKQPAAAQPAPTFVVATQAAPTAAGAGTGTTGGTVTEIATVQLGSDPAAHNTTTGGHANAATTASSGRVVDPSIAALLGGAGNGPSVGGSGPGGGAQSALSEESIQRVVQQRSAGVKRTCWERGGGTESNVNVRVHLVIAATGNVQNSSAEGNDPIVSKCIESSVQKWQFPVSSGSTTVDIPFHFLRQ